MLLGAHPRCGPRSSGTTCPNTAAASVPLATTTYRPPTRSGTAKRGVWGGRAARGPRKRRKRRKRRRGGIGTRCCTTASSSGSCCWAAGGQFAHRTVVPHWPIVGVLPDYVGVAARAGGPRARRRKQKPASHGIDTVFGAVIVAVIDTVIDTVLVARGLSRPHLLPTLKTSI